MGKSDKVCVWVTPPGIDHDGEIVERTILIGRLSQEGMIVPICDKHYEMHKATLYLSENLGMDIEDVLALPTEDFLKLKDKISQDDLDKVVA